MKKFLKLLLKSVLWSVAVVVLIVGVLIIRAYIQSQNSFWVDDSLSENVSVRWYSNKYEYRLYNYTEKKIVAKSLDRVVKPAEDDSLTVFFRQGLRGYINANTGRVVIPEQYCRAWIFSEGLAAVVNESGKVGFINKDNEVVMPFVYSYNRNKSVDYLFQSGLCVMINEQGMCGLIDTTGHWVVEPVYDYIWSPKYGKYRVVKQDGKYGLLDENSELLFPVVYDNIEIAWKESDGLMLTKDGIKQQVAYDGTVIQPFVFDGVRDLYYTKRISPFVMSDEDGCSSVQTEVTTLSDYLCYWIDGNCGVMCRATGEVILPALYDNIRMPSSTLFEAELLHVDGSILFDTDGKRVE